MSNAQSLTNMLMVLLVVMISILMILCVIFLVIKIKSKKKQEEGKIQDTNKPVSDAKKIAKEYTKDSVFKFMEFDKIEDNMIVQKNGSRYIMVVECQGVNYDLMSEAEKASVEAGFLQFLNTLRHPIQIYVQTRTVNLSNSIEDYKKRLQDIEAELEIKRNKYLKNIQTGNVSREELEKEFYEVTKQTNLYEYGKDIIESTERMNLNKSVLNKKYYIIIPYYSEELGNNAFDKEEIRSLAFAELYTKAQSIIRTLAGCEVNGKIMTSEELIDLLYVAYNRDESEVFGIDKAIQAGYEELYTTAPDVLDKQMKILDDEIEKQALRVINEKVTQVRSKKQQEKEQKEARFGELIRKRAEQILRENASYLGKDTANQAIEMIQEEADKKEPKQENTQENKKPTKTIKKRVTKEKGGNIDVGQETKQTKTTRGRRAKVTTK